MKVAAASSAKK